jgi:putative methionine-R-sulfoxide reductase with GAF domain
VVSPSEADKLTKLQPLPPPDAAGEPNPAPDAAAASTAFPEGAAAAAAAADEASARGKLERMMALTEVIASVLATDQRLDNALVALVEGAAALLGCQRVALYVVDWAAGTQRLTLSTGRIEEGIRLVLGSGLVGACAVTGAVVNVADAYADPRFDATVDICSSLKTSSELCVPLYLSSAAAVDIQASVSALTGGGAGGLNAAAVAPPPTAEGRVAAVLTAINKIVPYSSADAQIPVVQSPAQQRGQQQQQQQQSPAEGHGRAPSQQSIALSPTRGLPQQQNSGDDVLPSAAGANSSPSSVNAQVGICIPTPSENN